MKIFRYHFIDCYVPNERESKRIFKKHYLANPSNKMLSNAKLNIEYERLKQEAAREFKGYGWEGDGNIGLIWIPPFATIEEGDCHGQLVWHVKQSNNGTSFIGFPDCYENVNGFLFDEYYD